MIWEILSTISLLASNKTWFKPLFNRKCLQKVRSNRWIHLTYCFRLNIVMCYILLTFVWILHISLIILLFLFVCFPIDTLFKWFYLYHWGTKPFCFVIFHFAASKELLGVNFTSDWGDPDRSRMSLTVIIVFLLSNNKKANYVTSYTT